MISPFSVAEAIILLTLVFSALMVVKSKNLVSGVLFLALASLMVSIQMYLLQAPDVAIAEAGVGAVLTTAIFLFAIAGTDKREVPG